MIGGVVRPWGLLPWVLGRIKRRSWSFFGCLSTEDRCTAAWVRLRGFGVAARQTFVEVVDEPSVFSGLREDLVRKRRVQLSTLGVAEQDFRRLDLFAPHFRIIEQAMEFIAAAGPNVVIDVSCFPKRFFFPIVKLLLSARHIENLIVTYTSAESYFAGALAQDPQPLRPLPLFGPQKFPEDPFEIAFVGVGFVPLGIIELFQPAEREITVRLFFPFPASASDYQRSWQFVRHLEKSIPEAARDPVRVATLDVPDVFDHICSETNHGTKRAIFAPFGPKPISLAMCLYALKSDSVVSYTQPLRYHPLYSSGVRLVNGEEQIHAYCLRLNGNELYGVGAV
jgi:hypothetical protein